MKIFKGFLKPIVQRLQRWLTPTESEDVTPIAVPIAAPQVTAPVSTNPLHMPLVLALRGFPQSQLRIGQVIFHGCSASVSSIDVPGRSFLGTRKWFSSNAVYACNYGRKFGGANGNGLLWVCKVRKIIPALIGSQYSLISATPWIATFSSMFPDEFGRHARHITNGSGPIALLDIPDVIGYKEILISYPQLVLDVLHIRAVPSDQIVSDRFGRRVNAIYRNYR